MEQIIIRYAEVGLKGRNRAWFENRLMRNIEKHLEKLGNCRVSRIHGRIILDTDIPPDQAAAVIRHIPGIANFSHVYPATHGLADITTQAIGLMQRVAEVRGDLKTTFRISTSRSDKHFPLNSMQLSAKIGAEIGQAFPDLTVNLTQPEIEIGIEIWPRGRSILYREKHPGQGGLPSGSSGTVMAFISGGIDSPVAAWMMMKRGCTAVFVHFHSYPFVGEQSRQKVIDLVTHLSRYQPTSTLIIVPFANIQKAIKTACREKNRTILYRRLMYHVAEAIRQRYRIRGYVTGEAVGQVASQTLENLACTEAVATIPILRPLIGMGKTDITELARRIGTYPISIQPYPDCCTVFQPCNPEIHGQVSVIADDEAGLPLARLVEETLENLEIIAIETQIQDKYWS
jgi:tRNA uracil 4-sulfurtransferase